MDDKGELLRQLKIDRDPEPPRGGRAKWLVLAAAIVVIAAGAAFVLLRPPPALPVRAAVAVPGSAAAGAGSVLDASGYVVARRQATVSSKLTGKVVELLIAEGMPVKAGQVLARLDDANARAQWQLAQSQLDAARAAVVEVRVQLVEAERQLARTRELHGQKMLSDAALDNAVAQAGTLKARLDTAGVNVTVAERNVALFAQQLDDTIVRAPFAGVITVKNAQVGEMISPLSAGGAGTRTGIGTVVDMDSLEIEVDVNENFINRVRPEQRVAATLNAYPDWKIPAEVIAVIPTADRSKATVKVRIGIRERDPRILPDMGARVSFLVEEAPRAEAPAGVFVPRQALARDGGADVVFVIKDQLVARRMVTTGATRGDQIQVLGGLAAGERVALGELARLADGARVRVEP